MTIDVDSHFRDYEILSRLKAGGMATLFLAKRKGAAGFSRHVAVKVVHPHLAADPAFLEMFIDEALLGARIHHPNVVHIEELGDEAGTYFLAMEYVDGMALSSLLSALAGQDQRLSPELAVWLACAVLEGLHAAHELRGDTGEALAVIHRDVSPQNVLISTSGHVKLIDFGIAKVRGRGKQTEAGSLKGKIRYMSPEQAYGRALDRRTDVYALAVVLWETLAMRRMFEGDNDMAVLDRVRSPTPEPPSRYAPSISPALDAAVLHGLAPSVDDRPRTALEFRRLLLEAVPAATAADASQLGEIVRAMLPDGSSLAPQHALDEPGATTIPNGGAVVPSAPLAPATLGPAAGSIETGDGRIGVPTLRAAERLAPWARLLAVVGTSGIGLAAILQATPAPLPAPEESDVSGDLGPVLPADEAPHPMADYASHIGSARDTIGEYLERARLFVESAHGAPAELSQVHVTGLRGTRGELSFHPSRGEEDPAALEADYVTSGDRCVRYRRTPGHEESVVLDSGCLPLVQGLPSYFGVTMFANTTCPGLLEHEVDTDLLMRADPRGVYVELTVRGEERFFRFIRTPLGSIENARCVGVPLLPGLEWSDPSTTLGLPEEG